MRLRRTPASQRRLPDARPATYLQPVGVGRALVEVGGEVVSAQSERTYPPGSRVEVLTSLRGKLPPAVVHGPTGDSGAGHSLRIPAPPAGSTPSGLSAYLGVPGSFTAYQLGSGVASYVSTIGTGTAENEGMTFGSSGLWLTWFDSSSGDVRAWNPLTAAELTVSAPGGSILGPGGCVVDDYLYWVQCLADSGPGTGQTFELWRMPVDESVPASLVASANRSQVESSIAWSVSGVAMCVEGMMVTASGGGADGMALLPLAGSGSWHEGEGWTIGGNLLPVPDFTLGSGAIVAGTDPVFFTAAAYRLSFSASPVVTSAWSADDNVQAVCSYAGGYLTYRSSGAYVRHDAWQDPPAETETPAGDPSPTVLTATVAP